MENPTQNDLPPLRDLASSDPKLRRIATQNLLTHISSPDRTVSLDQTQCLQAWRALFVTMLMHDSKNQLSVQKLISSLADTFPSLAARDATKPQANADDNMELTTFTAAFWEVISHEWGNIDALRIDKMLLLIRMAIRQLFAICISEASKGNLALTRQQVTLFETWPLSPRERKVPDGLRYHSLDIWVDELERTKEAAVSAESAGDEEESRVMGVVKMLMEPVEKIAKDGLSKTVRTRAKETLSGAGERLGVGGLRV